MRSSYPWHGRLAHVFANHTGGPPVPRMFVLALLVIAGCHPLPKGDLSRVPTTDVYLLRGWRDIYSAGIDQLANELESDGYRPTVYRESQWKDIAKAIAASPQRNFILVGFSFGADHAIDVARKLSKENISVPLLITLDPVTPAKVPPNVRVCHNLYQSNGVWDIFPWFRGIPLKTDSSATDLINVDVHDRPDLDDPKMAHKTIAASPAIHQEIRRLIGKSAAPR